MMQAHMNGARLAYVVVALSNMVGETVQREVSRYTKKEGLTRKMKAQPAGYMVYFPRGHAIRLKDEAALRKYNLDGPASIVNLEGLYDPRSPLGQLMVEQDSEKRGQLMTSLEQQVIRLATAKSGPVIMPEQITKPLGGRGADGENIEA